MATDVSATASMINKIADQEWCLLLETDKINS